MSAPLVGNFQIPDKLDCSSETYSERTFIAKDGSTIRERIRPDGSVSRVKIVDSQPGRLICDVPDYFV